jgi:hypothetical protein
VDDVTELIPPPAGVTAGDPAGGERTTLVRAIRRDPGHAGALVLCSVLPSLATHAARSQAARSRSGKSADERAAAVVRHSRAVARRDGAFAGTSFYFGMPAVMASIYCHQALMILQIASVHGHDPSDPARAAEILVLQGKAPDVATAAALLSVVGTTNKERGVPRTALRDTVRGMPASARARWDAFRAKGPVTMILAVLEVVCWLVPLIGAPVSAASNARATRLLGDKARAFYGTGPAPPAAPELDPALHGRVAWGVKPMPPMGILVVLVLATAVLTVVTLYLGFHGPHHRHHTRWLLLGLAGAFVMITYGRLWWILRADRRASSAYGNQRQR